VTGEVAEHRLALVMNGGVSLAVWMGGVACEIENVRRASNGIPLPDGATKEEKALHDLWVRATRRIGVRVVVDVIAGTSAGGLNGVVHAAAIARGASMGGLKQLWLESGQFSADALLASQPQGGALSILNGDFFHQRISAALGQMAGTGHGRDISLIVTSTALGESSRPLRDSWEHGFSEADHRRRYRFSKHDSRPEYTDTGDGYEFRDRPAVDDLADDEPLATAARASASYPVAFAPVRETSSLRGRRTWPDWVTSDTLDWLADGGILDNSPFDPVLESIERRPVVGRWQRTVCFVVPSWDAPAPGGGVTAPAHGKAGARARELPPPWTSVAARALSFPGEVNYRDDIDHLHRTIRSGRSSLDVDRFRQFTERSSDPEGAAPGAAPGVTLARARVTCTAAVPLYQQSCAEAAIYQVRDVIARSRADGYIDPADTVTSLALDPAARPWLPDSFPAVGDPLPATWKWGIDAAGRVLRIMLRACMEEPELDELREDLTARIQRVVALKEAVDDYLTRTGKTARLSDNNVVAGLLDEAYRALHVSAALTPIVTGAALAYARDRLEDQDQAPDVLAAALAVEVINNAGSLPDESARPIFRFLRLGLGNPPPLLRAAYNKALQGTGETPGDGGSILYGTRLNNFAAFADPAWRAWDWMWGRLNALAHLATVLELTPDEVDGLTHAILAAEGRQLPAVRADIETVTRLTSKGIWEDLRSAGHLPAALDALFDLLHSQAPTDPDVWKDIKETGQAASDLFARAGHTGHVSHRFLRGLAVVFRERLWKAANPR
jgi:patatin-related protein